MFGLSPTQFEVRKNEIEREIEEARRSGDLPGLQRGAGKMTELFNRYYGRRKKVNQDKPLGG